MFVSVRNIFKLNLSTIMAFSPGSITLVLEMDGNSEIGNEREAKGGKVGCEILNYHYGQWQQLFFLEMWRKQEF